MAYEADLEAWCREQATKAGGYLLKWTSPGNKGVPDRILIMPDRIIFMEFKNRTSKLTSLQEVWQERLTRLGHAHAVIRTKEHFMSLLNAVAR